MTSIRIGTDLVHVEVVEDAIASFGAAYIGRVYTEREVRNCSGAQGEPAPERLAARFAAKEAAIKVLRPTDGMALTDIEVTIRPDGSPTLTLNGAAAMRGEELNLVDYSLSMTHDGAYAAAVLVAVGSDEQSVPMSDKLPHLSRAQELNVTERTDSIRNILTKHGRLSVPVEELKDDTSLYGAGLTSHATVNVMLALESEFDTEFPANLLRRSTFESIENLNLALQDVLGSEE
jgi:phosphopantetheine--protein transferase-like protein